MSRWVMLTVFLGFGLLSSPAMAQDEASSLVSGIAAIGAGLAILGAGLGLSLIHI